MKRNKHFPFRKMWMAAFLCALLLLPLSAQRRSKVIDFEDLRTGTQFKVGKVFTVSGVKIEAEGMIGRDGKPWPHGSRATIVKERGKAGGSGKEIFMDPMNIRFFFNYPLEGLRLGFAEYGIGNINIEINGDFRNEDHFTVINGDTIGGVKVTVIGGEKDKKGIIELSGRIESFMIGGFELFLDDICPIKKGISLYFSDSTESPGSVYSYYAPFGFKTKLYQRSSKRLYGFEFAPWDPNYLFFVNANEHKVYTVDLDSPGMIEDIIFNNTTYVRDIAFDAHNNLYFSEASGSGGDGKIYRIEADGGKTLYYRVKLSKFGFWAGNFEFGPDGTLYISSGNVAGASLYKVDVAANVVTKLLSSPGESIAGLTFGSDGHLYYANHKTRIYRVNLATLTKTVVYTDSAQQIWDVEFREKAPGSSIPGTWVMPHAVRAYRFDQLKSTGLIDYTDSGSGIPMNDAPFGGGLWFRLNSSNDIPTPAVHYYRYRCRRQGTAGWNDFESTISVHYVKTRPGNTPIFPTYKLGPYDVNGKKLYRFRPHKGELPSLVPVGPGETVDWPKIALPGDRYRAYLDTVAEGLDPGKYEIRIEIFNNMGSRTAPGPAYQLIIPTGKLPDGTITTDPAPITDDGLQYVVHIDNRKCSAGIDPPKIGLTETDGCGFLRYNPSSPGNVKIAWQAQHPAGFGMYRFNVVKGASGIGSLPIPGSGSPSIPLPIIAEVSSTAHHGDGAGNFYEYSPTLRLLDGCVEAAYSINLYVYAKATTGNGYRISGYDASKVRAFAIAPEKKK